jgi:hypothetical protein
LQKDIVQIDQIRKEKNGEANHSNIKETLRRSICQVISKPKRIEKRKDFIRKGNTEHF